MSKLINLKLILIILLILPTYSCGGKWGADARKVSPDPEQRVKKNLEEGRGFRLNDMRKKSKGTTYEFSTSNPLWRASLEILDFIPMTTVDYSGGTIISDWYTDGPQNNDSIKITLRFLSNEIRSDSLKVILHKKKCTVNQTCAISLVKQSLLIDELHSSILRKAAQIEIEQKRKKK